MKRSDDLFPALTRATLTKRKLDQITRDFERNIAIRTIAELTERDVEVLLTLAWACEEHAKWFGWELAWKTPMAVGGRDQSHHARTLTKLVNRGLAMTRKYHAIYCYFGTEGEDGRIIDGCCCKGSRRYRITKSGLDAVLELSRRQRRRSTCHAKTIRPSTRSGSATAKKKKTRAKRRRST